VKEAPNVTYAVELDRDQVGRLIEALEFQFSELPSTVTDEDRALLEKLKDQF
jgi:hypothetical protein